MKLKVTAELDRDEPLDPQLVGRGQVQAQRNRLHAFAKLLRDMADRMANGDAARGEFHREGVRGKYEIEE
jgi:hypothetical protein